MIYVFFITVFLIAICVLLLGFRVFFTKNGKFPNTHVEGNKALKEKGITCMKRQDREDFNKKNIFEIFENEEHTFIKEKQT